jgi:hypothetical protein
MYTLDESVGAYLDVGAYTDEVGAWPVRSGVSPSVFHRLGWEIYRRVRPTKAAAISRMGEGADPIVGAALNVQARKAALVGLGVGLAAGAGAFYVAKRAKLWR